MVRSAVVRIRDRLSEGTPQMGLLRRHRGVPLLPPQSGVMVVPDASVLSSCAKEVVEVFAEAVRVADTLPSETGRELAQGLAHRWWADEFDRTGLARIVHFSVRVGIAFAMIETMSRNPTRGHSDAVIVASIDYAAIEGPRALGAEADDDLDPHGRGHLMMSAAYSLRAGYYRARVGESAMFTLIAQAESTRSGLRQ